jgi:hypothetical protein
MLLGYSNTRWCEICSLTLRTGHRFRVTEQGAQEKIGNKYGCKGKGLEKTV